MTPPDTQRPKDSAVICELADVAEAKLPSLPSFDEAVKLGAQRLLANGWETFQDRAEILAREVLQGVGFDEVVGKNV